MASLPTHTANDGSLTFTLVSDFSIHSFTVTNWCADKKKLLPIAEYKLRIEVVL